MAMDVYHTIIKPLVTEKSSFEARRSTDKRGGAYLFEVRRDANKSQIRDAIEKIYNVKVQKVRTINELVGRTRRMRFGWTHATTRKKAVVVLHPNHAIDLF